MASAGSATPASVRRPAPADDIVDRLYASSPLSTWGTGFGVFVGLVALYLAATSPFDQASWIRIALPLALPRDPGSAAPS